MNVRAYLWTIFSRAEHFRRERVGPSFSEWAGAEPPFSLLAARGGGDAIWDPAVLMLICPGEAEMRIVPLLWPDDLGGCHISPDSQIAPEIAAAQNLAKTLGPARAIAFAPLQTMPSDEWGRLAFQVRQQ